MEIDRTVREILALVLGRPVGPMEDVARASESRWDSLKHVELVFALEDALGVRFGEAELPDLSSVHAIVARAEQRLAS